MTKRKYNELKKRLLEHDDPLAYRAILNDLEAAETADNDPEIMAYLEQQENLVDFYDKVLTEEERQAWHNAVQLATDALDVVSGLSGVAKQVVENLSRERMNIFSGGGLAEMLQDMPEAWKQTAEAWKEAQPYLEEILKRPEYALLTPYQLLVEKHIDEYGNEYTIFQKIREEIEEARAEEAGRQLPTISSKQADDLHKPTDKISNNLTRPFVRDKMLMKGQLRFVMAKDGTVPVTVSMSIDKDKLAALGVKDYITPTDITVIQALSTIYINDTLLRKRADIGKPVYCSPARLWRQMGGRSKMDGRARDRLEKILQKLATMWVELDTSQLLNEYTKDGATGRKYPLKRNYKGTLIHVDVRQKGILDGKETDSIITIYADPILMEFARAIGEVTTVPLYVVQATGTLNDDNLAIANYLQGQIAWLLKEAKRNATINLESLKEKTGTIKRDKALKAYIEGLLTEYANPPKDKKGNTIFPAWIAGFKPVPTGYKILLPSNKQLEDKKSAKKVTKRRKKPRK